MEHPYGEQYSQEGNPRAYMTMRYYRDLPYQWQQPVERNPSEYRSMRDYRDQWMSAPVYSVPSTYPPPPHYDHPEPPFYASTPQSPQSPQPPPLSLVEQAILDLTRIVNDFVEENKEINAHSIVTVEDNLNKKIDGLKDDFEHKWDNLQDSIEDLIDQQQCPPKEDCQSDIMTEEQRVVTVRANQETETVESSLVKELDGSQSRIDQKLDILQESISKLTNQFIQEEENLEEECLTEPILVEQAQLQPQEELKVELVETPPEELQDTPESGDTFWPWKKEEQISALISEEESQEEECLSDTTVGEQCQQHLLLEPSDIGAAVCPWENHTALLSEEINGKEPGEVPKKNVIQPNPIDLDTTATAQDTKYPLPVAPSVDQVYILPSPAPQPTPATKSKPAAPAPKAKSNPLPAAPPDSVFILPMPAAQPKPQASTTKVTPSLLVLQNIRRLVASVQAFSTTSKKMANTYIAWHSGWFWCGFGFGASEPRHF